MSTVKATLKPRKSAVQARSVATVEALHTATLQVLTQQGLIRCTTTRVAKRAGMSVGSLYQYYPNRDALLATVLEQHLNTVATAVETACQQCRGQSVIHRRRDWSWPIWRQNCTALTSQRHFTALPGSGMVPDLSPSCMGGWSSPSRKCWSAPRMLILMTRR